MEKMHEYLDAWMKSQKDFMDNWLRSQKEVLENWTEATRTMQESLIGLGASQEGTRKEMLSLCNSALATMVDSSKVLTDEAEKIQETLKMSVEKQMDMSREMVKNFTDIYKQAA